MKWKIPAKTFLLGEYAAIAGIPAFVLTTTPCFEVSTSNKPGLHGIHPLSPAGRYWVDHGLPDVGLTWHDPYYGKGGLGASSAQFIGVYRATHYLQQKNTDAKALLAKYFEYAWNGQGLRPSGYDVIAQSLNGCVYIHPLQNQTFKWPFKDLSFLLLHTGKKLATHLHLEAMALPNNLEKLGQLVALAKSAFESHDQGQFIQAINAYHQQLLRMNLVAQHSHADIDLLTQVPGVQAVKGCGAMGSDVLLVLVKANQLFNVRKYIETAKDKSWDVLATQQSIYELCS